MMQASRRAFLGFMAIATAGALAGCSTFRPVYGDNEMPLAFKIDPPKTPEERVAWREFVARFDSTETSQAPVLKYSVAISGLPGRMTSVPSGTNPITGRSVSMPSEAAVRSTITATVVYDGETVFEATRFADAGYTSGRTVIADMASADEAGERATKAAAESIRLALIAEFPKHEQMWSRATR